MGEATFHCINHQLLVHPKKPKYWVHQMGKQQSESVEGMNRHQRRIHMSSKTKKTPWWKSKP